MANPKVSVIVPVFNAAKFLDDALRSISNQTFRDFECIVINDGSTDSSQKIADKIAAEDKRFRVVCRENKGLVFSLNEAIDLAGGDYIARMDADDIALPERLERQVEFLNHNPSCDILGGQATVINEQGCESGTINRPLEDSKIKVFLENGCPLVHPTYMVRVGVYRRLGGYKDVIGAEDLEFLIRAAIAGSVMWNLAESLIRYRTNPGGASARNAQRQLKSTRLLCARYRHMKRRGGFHVSNKPVIEPKYTRAFSNSAWFTVSLGLRNRFLDKSRGQHRRIDTLGAMVCSLMHYELFFAGLRAYRNKKFRRAQFGE